MGFMPVALPGKTYSDQTAEKIDAEVKAIVEEAQQRTRELIESNRDTVHRLAEALLKYETLNVEDVKDIALRNYYFNRCISLREGYHPSKDDYLPPRAFEEPITDKYGTTWIWDKAEFEEEKRRYYVKELELTEEGLPPRKALERLGLDFVIPKLEQMGAVG